jgi:prevent-host-death family protein
MASVGIRELRQQASRLLRRVERGESIEITDRGRPVAILSPIPDEDIGPMERLRQAGDVTPAKGSIGHLPPPLRLEPGQEAPSVILARMRADER